MTISTHQTPKNTLPTQEQAAVAKASHKVLASLPKDQTYYNIEVMENETQGQKVTIPAPALDLLIEVLAIIGQGNTVKVTAIPKELNISHTADILGVSKDYVWSLLDAGQIPYKVQGNLRTISYEDVIEYKNRQDSERMKALDELAAQAQELDMGY
ncbi:MAG: helix-turn-helix domain-containing protein [Scytonema sp. PMC 1069.18]|nr:helix-turn-helix domain-containing protein [Scytonema sp. PMC 1069.18]MEC4885445.1 helix-turn-helix domain-containing protein [Scytonema sp. PMC 1070.18]